MQKHLVWSLALGLAPLATGCHADNANTADAGIADAAPLDAPAVDALPAEAGEAGPAGFVQTISDFESGGRNGVSIPVGVLFSWFAWANLVDRFGQVEVPAAAIAELTPPRGDSRRAFHMVGGPYEDGADLFVDFHPVGGAITNQVDLGRYLGVVFWMRGTPASHVYLAIQDGSVAGTGHEFWEAELVHNMPWPSRRLLAEGRWQRHVVLFEDLERGQGSNTQPGHLDTSSIHSIHFIVGTGGASGRFDVWIDDVSLLCRAPCQDR
jgi:hypothetical protein